jgi:hypothetical protein
VSIGLVFDPTAIADFARGSDAVGELLRLAGEDASLVGLPAAALAQAFTDVSNDGHGMLRLLALSRTTVVLPLTADDTEEVGIFSRLMRSGTAHAVVVALDAGAFLVTQAPRSVDAFVDPEMIIEV